MTKSQLYVAYSYIDLGRLRTDNVQIHRSEYVAVEQVDPKSHAKQAPHAAEWFSYVTGNGKGVYTPVDNTPLYNLNPKTPHLVTK